jgi:hypothetical protein
VNAIDHVGNIQQFDLSADQTKHPPNSRKLSHFFSLKVATEDIPRTKNISDQNRSESQEVESELKTIMRNAIKQFKPS